MGFVVIRRFRGDDAQGSSRVYRDEKAARAAARAWAEEGWEVELVSTARGSTETVKVEPPKPMPERPASD